MVNTTLLFLFLPLQRNIVIACNIVLGSNKEISVLDIDAGRSCARSLAVYIIVQFNLMICLVCWCLYHQLLNRIFFILNFFLIRSRQINMNRIQLFLLLPNKLIDVTIILFLLQYQQNLINCLRFHLQAIIQYYFHILFHYLVSVVFLVDLVD